MSYPGFQGLQEVFAPARLRQYDKSFARRLRCESCHSFTSGLLSRRRPINRCSAAWQEPGLDYFDGLPGRLAIELFGVQGGDMRTSILLDEFLERRIDAVEVLEGHVSLVIAPALPHARQEELGAGVQVEDLGGRGNPLLQRPEKREERLAVVLRQRVAGVGFDPIEEEVAYHLLLEQALLHGPGDVVIVHDREYHLRFQRVGYRVLVEVVYEGMIGHHFHDCPASPVLREAAGQRRLPRCEWPTEDDVSRHGLVARRRGAYFNTIRTRWRACASLGL